MIGVFVIFTAIHPSQILVQEVSLSDGASEKKSRLINYREMSGLLEIQPLLLASGKPKLASDEII
jgi:hypothetical protein